MHIQKRLFSFLLPFLCLCAVVPALSSVAFAYEVGDTYPYSCRSCGQQNFIVDEVLVRQDCMRGESLNLKCPLCSRVSVGVVVGVGSPEKHVWSVNSRTPATCTAAGSVTYVCSVCFNAKKTDVLPALDHDWRESSRINATCTAVGSVNYSCSGCSETKSDPLPALGGDHTWTETRRTAAASTAAGSVIYSCSRCSETKTDPLSALDHDWRESSRINATCTTPGNIGYTCSRCPETRSDTIPQLAQDHTWTETIRTPATCTAAGSVAYD